MASVFGHAIVGYTITKISGTNFKWLFVFAIISTILPDIDVLAFNLGIPYSHPLGHRGFTHSMLFALIWAVIIAVLCGKKHKLIWFVTIFLATISHGVLDAMTSGGRGIGFLIPFNNQRFFFPFREIQVSPIGVARFFSEWGMQVVISEIKYIIIPCLLLLIVRFLLLSKKNGYIS